MLSDIKRLTSITGHVNVNYSAAVCCSNGAKSIRSIFNSACYQCVIGGLIDHTGANVALNADKSASRIIDSLGIRSSHDRRVVVRKSRG